jgi:spermidine synthase
MRRVTTESSATITARPPGSVAGIVIAFTAAIFLSAALLFVVQPMVGKMILPLLGGTPAVWATCMVFFQACLLLGYTYAHLATRWIPPRVQPILHVGIMLLPLLALPIGLPAGWAPPTTDNPVGWVLLLLAATAGLPFVLVSTSGPLLQRWFARTGHPDAHDPYFLYAASNLGSMIALLGYPLAIEPMMRLAQQAWAWTMGYGALVVMTAGCAVLVLKARGEELNRVEDPAAEAASPLSWRERGWWVLLAFVPSSYLLGATTYVTGDLAAVPLLWVVPLALYLLSFIFVFARRQLLPHRWMVAAMPWAIVLSVMAMLLELRQPLGPILLLHFGTLFLVAMVCHGELARRRPHPTRLTEFYLLLSVGGVLGGIFNALLAPVLFVTAVEYPIAIALACFMAPVRPGKRGMPVPRLALDIVVPLVLLILTWAVMILFTVQAQPRPLRMAMAAVPAALALTGRRRPIRFGLSVAAILAAVAAAELTNPQLLWIGRSFFGIHKVQLSSTGGDFMFNELLHGTTLHGRQRVDPATGRPVDPGDPTSYYHETSPIAQFVRGLLARPAETRPRDMAVVGLGTGSLAAFADPSVRVTFYEIDPLVKEVAENEQLFSFVSDARQRGALIDIILGDARFTLGDHAADNSLDVLFLDAFTGDAIPVHLLTREAMDRYVSKMRPGGIIAIQISNRYLDFKPVVANLARHAGWFAVARTDWGTLTREQIHEGKQASSWVLLARQMEDFGDLPAAQGWDPLPDYPPKFLWTDDFSNIIGIFDW